MNTALTRELLLKLHDFLIESEGDGPDSGIRADVSLLIMGDANPTMTLGEVMNATFRVTQYLGAAELTQLRSIDRAARVLFDLIDPEKNSATEGFNAADLQAYEALGKALFEAAPHDTLPTPFLTF